MRLVLLFILVPYLAQAAEAWPRLYASEASATSFLRNNWNKYQENYHPNYVLDDDPKTAWVEGAEGDGLGASLTIPVSALSSARAVRLVIFNGYQKSPALLVANAAPRQLTVIVRNATGGQSARKQLTLERKMGPQSFDIPVEGGVAEVVLTLDSVHPGSKYRDTCISDVQIFVDSDVKYNAAHEEGKREALLEWKTARLEDAKYFASLPKDYPYASTRFDYVDADAEAVSLRYLKPVKAPGPEAGVSPSDDESSLQVNKDFVSLSDMLKSGRFPASLSAGDTELIKELEALTHRSLPEVGWYSLSYGKQGHYVLPENLLVEDYVADALDVARGSLVAAKGSGLDNARSRKTSNLLLLEGSPGGARKIYFAYVRAQYARVATTDTTHVLALFEGNRLVRLVSKMNADMGERRWVQVVVPGYTQGKMSRLEQRTLKEYSGGLASTEGVFLETDILEAARSH